MKEAISEKTFETLFGISRHSVLLALSDRSSEQNLGTLGHWLSHVERHGFGGLEANEKMRVHPDDMAKTKKDKSQNAAHVTDRLTKAMARFLAPKKEQTSFCGKTSMFAKNFWTQEHESLSIGVINVIKKQGTRAMLGDFAFDVVSMIPHPGLIEKLIAAGVTPTEKGQTPSEQGIEHQSLLREALLWGNLSCAKVLTEAMPADAFKTLFEKIITEQSFKHASGEGGHVKRKEFSSLHMAVVENESCHEDARGLLDSIDKKNPEIGARFRNAVMDMHFEMALVTKRGWTWTDKRLSVLMGSADVENLAETALARKVNASELALGAFEYEAAQTLAKATQVHCAPFLRAVHTFVRKCAILDAANLVSVNHAVRDDSFAIVSEGAIKPGAKERFKDTLQVFQSLGLFQTDAKDNHKRSVLHALSHNTRAEDRSHKLPLLLDLGADPDAKDAKGSKPRIGVKIGPEREEWDFIVRTHQARSSAYKALEKMNQDIAIPSTMIP